MTTVWDRRRADDTHRTLASRRGTPFLPGRGWHSWPQPEEQQRPTATSSWLTTDGEEGDRDDMQEAAGGFSLAFMALSEPFFLFSVLLRYKNRKCACLCLRTLSVYLTCLVCVCVGYRMATQSHSFIRCLGYDQSGDCQQFVLKKKKATQFYNKAMGWHANIRRAPTYTTIINTFFKDFLLPLVSVPASFFYFQFKVWSNLIVRKVGHTRYTSKRPKQEILHVFY